MNTPLTTPKADSSHYQEALDRLQAAYNPDTFRTIGHQWVDTLANYLTHAMNGPTNMPVLPWKDPQQQFNDWPLSLHTGVPLSPEAIQHLHQKVLDESNHLHHPHYIGHQVSAPLPLSALCEMTAALSNNGTAIYDMGPVSTAMERHLNAWLGEQLGFPKTCQGFFTSGGTVGNLTALLAARQAKAPNNVWKDGYDSQQPLAILVSDQSHYSIQRAVQILGWGESGMILVPTQADFSLDPHALEAAYQQAMQQGKYVIAVVANACSTATGSYDPLDPIADFCQHHDLWLHVDGAHGASAVLSNNHRHHLQGIHRADSVVWDMHKLMMMPALMTAVLFRNGDDSYSAFSQKAHYLFDAHDPHEQWYNLAQRTMECTKRFMSFKLYMALATYGPQLFADYIDVTYEQANVFARLIANTPDFELALEPQSNIVCFRYMPDTYRSASTEHINQKQTAIRNAIVEHGEFYLVQTLLKNQQYLRITLMNPFTSAADCQELLDTARHYANVLN